MDPLSVTASIIAILQLSNKVIKYLNNVKDAPSDRTQCAVEILNLCSLLYKLRDHAERADPTKPWYAAVQGMASKVGPLDQFKQALEMLQSRLTDGGRLRKAREALIWKFKKEEVADFLTRIERLKTLIEIALHMDHFELSEAIKDDTGFVRREIPVIQSSVETIRQDQISEAHRRLLDWLSTSDYPAQHSDILKRKQEGTGQWFLSSPEFVQWLHAANSSLFCPGIPGAGKTMIATIAIDHLLKLVRNTSIGVAYVYCNYKAKGQQDVQSILLAILKQLVQRRLSSIEAVQRLYESRGNTSFLNDISSALRDVLSDYASVYIVIDALDECRDDVRGQLLVKLQDLQAKRNMCLMVTSRSIPDVENAFQQAAKVEINAIREDVKRFVAGQLPRLPNCIQRDTLLQETVQQNIVDAADGMFLLARLHVDSLRDKRTVKDVKSTLSNLTKGAVGVDKAYKEALQRIQSQLEGDRQLAKKVLCWITFAKRPLTAKEICCALAVEYGDVELDDESVPDVEDLVAVCAGLVVVDKESAILRLVHYTTQDYFERTTDACLSDSHFYIASTCLTYLNFSTFQTGWCSTQQNLEERLHQNHFLDYAANYWGTHARLVENEVTGLTFTWLHSGAFACAKQILALTTREHIYHYECSTPLHITAIFGLLKTTAMILSGLGNLTQGAVNAEDTWGRTPLTLAARQGSSEMIQLLLDNGANVNMHGQCSLTALTTAASGGHKQAVKVLLSAGANVNEIGKNGAALRAASRTGNEEVVRMLLNAGADINENQCVNGTALTIAAGAGNEQMTKLLLDEGADINLGSPICKASAEGHEQIVELLLRAGADVNTINRWSLTALIAAAEAGNHKIVDMLLSAGADVNAIHEDDEFHSALWCASWVGNERIVKALLRAGAHVDLECGYSGTALWGAACGGHESIVKILLAAKADVNTKSDEGTALASAAAKGYTQIVKMLIDAKADVNDHNRLEGSALYRASARGDNEMVKLLLDAGADANGKGGRRKNHYPNALHAASTLGHHEVVKMLINAGAIMTDIPEETR